VVEFLVRNNATDSTILQCVKCNSNIHTLPNDTKQLSSVRQKCVERRSAGAQERKEVRWRPGQETSLWCGIVLCNSNNCKATAV